MLCSTFLTLLFISSAFIIFTESLKCYQGNSPLSTGQHIGPPLHEPVDCGPTGFQSCMAMIDPDNGIVMRSCYAVKCQTLPSFATLGAGKGLACVPFGGSSNASYCCCDPGGEDDACNGDLPMINARN